MKKSKVDEIIKRKVTEAEERGRRAGVFSGVAEGRKREREDMTLLLAPQEGAVLLGSRPEFGYVRVPISDIARRMPNFSDLNALHALQGSMRLRLATFRSVQKCWSTSEGHKVAWYEWQFEGMS